VSEIKVSFRIPPERPTPNYRPELERGERSAAGRGFDAKDRQRSLRCDALG
jgi:hypothetical protein